MERKNVIMGLVLVVLLIAALSLLYKKNPTERMEIDSSRFTVQDTASIAAIHLHQENSTLSFIRNNGSWTLDNEKVDERLNTLFLSVMINQQVKRAATRQEWEKAVTMRPSIEVALEINGEARIFEVAGNDERQTTFFKDDDGYFLIAIPGYDAYLASIFRLRKGEWLSRDLFSTNYRRIKKVSISYSSSYENDFVIVFDNQDFKVVDLPSYSKDRIMQYLDVFQEVRVRKRLSDNDMAEYKDLLETVPLATLALEDIKKSESKTIKVFELPGGEEEMLIHWDDEKYALIEKHWIENLFASKSDFKSEP